MSLPIIQIQHLNKTFGTMLLGLPKDPKEAGKALDYIKSQPDITVEEVSGHA